MSTEVTSTSSAPDTDSFLRAAIESQEPKELLEAEKKIVHRHWGNQATLPERVDTAFNAIDRRLHYYQGMEANRGVQNSNRINLAIACITAVSVLVGAVFGYIQYRNSSEALRLQRTELEAEYRPYLGAYFSLEYQKSTTSSTSSTRAITGELAGCNYRIFLYDNQASSALFLIPIKNYGKTPAVYKFSDLFMRNPSSTQMIQGTLLTFPEGHLMPEEDMEVRYQLPIDKFRLDPQFGMENLEFLSEILYRPIGSDISYTSTIAAKPKPVEIGSNKYCFELMNERMR